MGTRAFYFPGLRHCIRISGFSIAHHRAAHEIFYRVGGTLFAWSHTSISVWQQSTGIPSLPLIGEAPTTCPHEFILLAGRYSLIVHYGICLSPWFLGIDSSRCIFSVAVVWHLLEDIMD